MGHRVERREFLVGAASALLASGCRTPFGNGVCYSVAILGDTHFDAEPDSVYHSHYRNEGKKEWLWKVQRQEFARNGEMWRGRCRDLLKASAAVAGATSNVEFVLQLGDLIQGDCDDAATHRKMLADAIATMRAPYPQGLPFLTVVGNHDFRGLDAEKAYFDFIEPYLGHELGEAVKFPAFSFRHGPDLWIFCHFERVRAADLIRLIDSGRDARHVFLVSHGPFTPGESTLWYWRLGGGWSASDREALMSALLRNQVVVLSGHTHEIAWWHIVHAKGSYSEFTVNSVWASPGLATAKPLAEQPSQYGEWTLAQLEKRDEKRAGSYRADIEMFKRGLADYFFNQGAGHFRLNVSEGGVTMDYFPGAAVVPARTFVLK